MQINPIMNNNDNKNINFLERFGRNLNEYVKSNKSDSIIGRTNEINSLIRILSRKTKNNPVLIGEPGVGKTAIIEGLTRRIVNNDVPENLKNRTIFELDMGALVAGTKFQGEFEFRLKNIINQIKKSSGRIILFIDELHLIVGAGKTQGAMDASNLLKPILARGTIRCIGATTLNEYRENIEKDGALERRYQKIFVDEPTEEETISILRGLRENYEIYHGIKITDRALVSAVELSTRYINDRFLPDKAIDLIDEASASIKTQITSVPIKLDELNNQIMKLKIERVSLSKETEVFSINRVKKIDLELKELEVRQKNLTKKWNNEKNNINQLNNIKSDISKLKEELENSKSNSNWTRASEIQYSDLPKKNSELNKLEKGFEHSLINKEVTRKDIAQIISKWTKIPLENLIQSESKKILNLKKTLLKRVKGQDDAINKICDAIWRSKSGIQDPTKPIGSFLFLGPTGVGKTELARSLTYALFGSEDKIIQLDMSEYMEKHSVSKIIGSPPGYIGFEQGGKLTEKVRRNPYSIILFDEIEKAHKDVINIFLQIFDKGVLTDSIGRRVNFKNTIIIMTSNIASHSKINDNINPFIRQIMNATDAHSLNRTKSFTESELLNFFSLEFLNRIDNIIRFRSLDFQVIKKIIHKELDMLLKRVEKNLNIRIKIESNVISKIAKEGYDQTYGARTIQKYIKNNIEILIAKSLINKTIQINNIYSLSLNKEKEFIISKKMHLN